MSIQFYASIEVPGGIKAVNDEILDVTTSNAWFLQTCLGLKPDYCGNLSIAEAKGCIEMLIELATTRPEEITGTTAPCMQALQDEFRAMGATIVNGTRQDATRALMYAKRLQKLLSNGIKDGATGLAWS